MKIRHLAAGLFFFLRALFLSGMDRPDSYSCMVDPYVKNLPDGSFCRLYFSMNCKDFDSFETEIKKKSVDQKDLNLLLEASILTENKKAYDILIKNGARIGKLDVKIIARIPKSFLNKKS